MRFKIEVRVIILFILSVTGFALLSPKWNVALCAWIAPAALLLLGDGQKVWRSGLLTFFALFISGLIANYRVMPFPAVFLIPLCIQIALVGSIPYLAVNLLHRHLKGWLWTLSFPAFAVLVEYLASFGGGGVWGSIANSQTGNLPLMQLTSVFGLWGVSFLIYWWASMIVWSAGANSWKAVKIPAAIYLTIIVLVFLFGINRLTTSSPNETKTVRVASITAVNLHALFVIYEEAFGKKLKADAQALTQTSPELAELNKGLALFIEDPSDSTFRRTFTALSAFHDSLFAEAAVQARGGAKMIAFSEALMFTIKPKEQEIIEKGRKFARQFNVRLFLALGTFIPGKIELGGKFIENKVISINEKGEIEDVFFKNKPVPIVEGSIAGDGEIPVLQTSFGRIATSICYDADFPALMRKAGQQKADLMVLPSGDWPEISPYHAEIASVRAIENGFTLIRPVSNATSIACDAYGRLVASMEFSKKGITAFSVDLPIDGVPTLYSQFGDTVPFACSLLALWVTGSAIHLKRRNRNQSPIEVSAG